MVFRFVPYILGCLLIFNVNASKSFDEYIIIEEEVPNYCHWIDDISLLGDIIYLDDGTGWEVIPWDRYILNNWPRHSLIMIMKNDSWFRMFYDYIALNVDTGEYVRVALHSYPYTIHPETTYLHRIDYCTQIFVLSDGSHWITASEKLQNWDEDDVIVIGTLSSEGYNEYDELLFVNARRAESLIATRL